MFENIFIGPLSSPECLWVHVMAFEWVWTALEHPLGVNECHWVRIDAIEWVWTPIECAWMPICHDWTQLTMMWPWERSYLCENWTAPEHDGVHLNTFEWVLTPPWTLLRACEHRWVSIEHPLNLNVCECMWAPLSGCGQPQNTHWVRMHAFG